MPGPLDLIKSFTVSKQVVYIGGDPMPYVAEVTIPGITAPTETFNNTSTGGELEVADPWRKMPDGDGEIKIEAEDKALAAKIYDSTKIQSLKLSCAVNALNPQLGQFLPLPIVYTIGAQFFGVDPGAIAQGKKRDITAKFKMFNYKMSQNFIDVVDFDFANGVYLVNGADLLALVGAIL